MPRDPSGSLVETRLRGGQVQKEGSWVEIWHSEKLSSSAESEESGPGRVMAGPGVIGERNEDREMISKFLTSF